MAGPAAAAIRRAIADAGGPIPFAEFHRLALYGPGGFYCAGGRAGRHGGDFLTSPEVGPLFGTVLARYVDARWRTLGRPEPFTVVDAGAGPGTLARAVVDARPECAAALCYVAVEVSAPQRASHPTGVTSRATLPDGAFKGVIIANELLDDMPFRLAVFDGAWREAFVAEGDDGRFVEVLSVPFDPPPVVLPVAPRLGARAPLQDEAAAWVTAAKSLLTAGSLLVLDYARPTTAQLVASPWREWLRTYRRHGRGSHYLAEPGGQDVTVELALDQLPAPDTVRTQAQFLSLHGIADLVDEGRRGWSAATHDDAHRGIDALRLRSRVREAEALLDGAGLGAFAVLEWHV